MIISVTYIGFNLSLDRQNYFFDASPLVGIFGAAPDHAKALEYVNNIIDSPPFDA